MYRNTGESSEFLSWLKVLFEGKAKPERTVRPTILGLDFRRVRDHSRSEMKQHSRRYAKGTNKSTINWFQFFRVSVRGLYTTELGLYPEHSGKPMYLEEETFFTVAENVSFYWKMSLLWFSMGRHPFIDLSSFENHNGPVLEIRTRPLRCEYIVTVLTCPEPFLNFEVCSILVVKIHSDTYHAPRNRNLCCWKSNKCFFQ